MLNIGVSLNVDQNNKHNYIQTTGKPLSGIITLASLIISNQYLNTNLSIKKWRKVKDTYQVNYTEPSGEKKRSKPINYLIISNELRQEKGFDILKFGLPDLNCPWLDHASEIKLGLHIADAKNAMGIASGDLQAHYYGESYPIKPILKREGHLYTSFQPQLIKRIIVDRSKLIAESNSALTDDWIFDLRNLINNSISLLDVAFTQFYIKAEYDPLPNWKFDKVKLGERHGRRLKDKIKWVKQITGNEFNIEGELSSLDNLRMLRNHLMHFDPPSLVVTLEDATLWLNQIIDIGKILIKFRQAIDVPISINLVNFILQEEAIFVPSYIGKRIPHTGINNGEDYFSSTWPLPYFS